MNNETIQKRNFYAMMIEGASYFTVMSVFDNMTQAVIRFP